MSPKPYDFALIIPAYNEENYLPDTLKAVQISLKALPQKKGLIVVIDNDSDDQTCQVAQSFPEVTLLHEKTRQISAVRNKGGFFASDKTDKLIFLDADTLLNSKVLEESLKALDDSKIIGGGALLTMSTKRLLGKFIICFWTLLSKTFSWAPGSYTFCRSKDFLAINGFSTDLYAAEDVDFSHRLKKIDKSKKYIVIPQSLETSSRKLEWYSSFQLLSHLLPIAINPRRLKHQQKLDLWYKRPESTKPPSASSQKTKKPDR